jgi:hypothetical protein
MSSRDGLALNIVGPLLPQAERTPIFFVPAVERSLLTPQGQQRTGDAPAVFAIGFVVIAINRGGGAVILANGMSMVRVAEYFCVGRTNFSRNSLACRPSVVQCAVDD